VAKRKPKIKPKTPEQIEFRHGVRAYASRLLSTVVGKRRGEGFPLPDDKQKRLMAIGCIRWGIVAMEVEDRFCTMEDDVEERQEFQDKIDGDAA